MSILSKIIPVLTATATIAMPVAQAHPIHTGTDYVETFDSPEALSNWKILTGTTYENSNAQWSTNNQRVENGNLVIETKRHCLKDPTEALTKANTSTAPCPPGTTQKFSTARLESPFMPSAKKFQVSVTARIDDGSTNGVRSNIWMQNGHPACTQPTSDGLYGELDILELYSGSHRRGWTTSNTHFGCTNGLSNNAARQLFLGEKDINDFHTYTVVADNDSISYYVDSHMVSNINFNPATIASAASPKTMENISEEEYKKILHNPWKIILNQSVESQGWADPASNEQNFPTRTLVIDKIEYSQ